jgi:hypothetical protein
LTGAKYAAFTIFAVSLPVGLVTGIVFHEYLVGTGLMFVALGSLVFPEASAAATYGYFLAKGESVADFFTKAGKYFLSREMRVVFWLALLLRRTDLCEKIVWDG